MYILETRPQWILYNILLFDQGSSPNLFNSAAETMRKAMISGVMSTTVAHSYIYTYIYMYLTAFQLFIA